MALFVCIIVIIISLFQVIKALNICFNRYQISQVGKLRQIDLLHRYHDCYRLTDVKGFVNNKLIFQELSKQPWSYTLPWNSDERKGRMEVAITVSFNTTKLNQTSTQCLRFDFGKKPYLLQGLNVDIANMDALKGVSEIRQQLQLDPIVWTEGSIDIVPWPEITDTSHHDVLLLEKYRLPERIENVISLQIVERNLSMENYKRVMHQLLFTEELFMKKAISRCEDEMNYVFLMVYIFLCYVSHQVLGSSFFCQPCFVVCTEELTEE